MICVIEPLLLNQYLVYGLRELIVVLVLLSTYQQCMRIRVLRIRPWRTWPRSPAFVSASRRARRQTDWRGPTRSRRTPRTRQKSPSRLKNWKKYIEIIFTIIQQELNFQRYYCAYYTRNFVLQEFCLLLYLLVSRILLANFAWEL